MNEDDEKQSPSKNLQGDGLDSPNGSGEDLDYYMNPDGFVVFTSKYLLERGYCCGNGCKNCPYDYKAVPEPRRTRLLEQKKNSNNAS